MRLHDLDDVQIDDDAVGRNVKFILVSIKDDSGSKIILRASTAEFHNEIYAELLDSIDENMKTEVNGGGKLHISIDEKTIRIWGSSNVFGPPDYRTAERLLRGKYPEFRIEIEQ